MDAEPYKEVVPVPARMSGDVVGDTKAFSREERKKLLRRASERMKNREAEDTGSISLNVGGETHIGDAAALPKLPALEAHDLPIPYVKSTDGVAKADSHRLLDNAERIGSQDVRRVEDPVRVKEQKIMPPVVIRLNSDICVDTADEGDRSQKKKASAGSDWYNLPKTNLTPELKRDLQLLKMRGILDTKRFYKKESTKTAAPAFSQVGTIVEGPTEYYSARLQNKEKKRTLVEEILSDETTMRRFKNNYAEIQSKTKSGKKEFYRKLKGKRSKPA